MTILFATGSVTLPRPANTDDITAVTHLAARMSGIAADSRFAGVGIGVIEFDGLITRVWMQNESLAFRLASTAKLAILLAAMQLREDVRELVRLHPDQTPAQLSATMAGLFAASTEPDFRRIGRHPPRIATIFDLEAATPDFRGKGDARTHSHLTWAQATNVSFWERMTMAGALSDNLAASSLISQIGLPYLKAVQRRMGLYAPARGMCLFLSYGYAGVEDGHRELPAPDAPNFRPLTTKPGTNPETQPVVDILVKINSTTKKPYSSATTTQGGSAAALTAFMLGLVQETLVSAEASRDIQAHLTKRAGFTNACLTFDGVERHTPVTRGFAKVGILLGAIRAEFAYVEAGGKKFALVATGLRGQEARRSQPQIDMKEQGRSLAEAVYLAL
jgi:hypothetical protein